GHRRRDRLRRHLRRDLDGLSRAPPHRHAEAGRALPARGLRPARSGRARPRLKHLERTDNRPPSPRGTSMPIRTRFAPSPTGSLHVGGVRTALYCLLLARSTGGRFVLRIEDTDRARSTEESYRGILRDLRWLGLQWDEGPDLPDPGPHGPYLQSQRLDLYNRYVDQLLASGHAYLAWETPEELDAERRA